MLNEIVNASASIPVNPVRGSGVLLGVIIVGVLIIWAIGSFISEGKK